MEFSDISSDGQSSDLSMAPYASGEISLILAAEKLFAERGIQGASLRQINIEAGSKNLSAAHYHFGSREGLIHAILKYREIPLERRRLELLLRHADNQSLKDIRYYLEAYIRPLAETLAPRPEGNYYLRFLAQYRHAAQNHDVMQTLIPAAYKMGEALYEAMDYLPELIIKERVQHLRGIIIVSLADAEAEISAGVRDPCTIPLLGENLIDMMAGALTAPVSNLAKREL